MKPKAQTDNRHEENRAWTLVEVAQPSRQQGAGQLSRAAQPRDRTLRHENLPRL